MTRRLQASVRLAWLSHTPPRSKSLLPLAPPHAFEELTKPAKKTVFVIVEWKLAILHVLL